LANVTTKPNQRLRSAAKASVSGLHTQALAISRETGNRD
jgi:hypothetical protein